MHTKWRQLDVGAYEILVYTLKTSLLGCHLTHGLLEHMILLNLLWIEVIMDGFQPA